MAAGAGVGAAAATAGRTGTVGLGWTMPGAETAATVGAGLKDGGASLRDRMAWMPNAAKATNKIATKRAMATVVLKPALADVPIGSPSAVTAIE